MDFRSLAQMLGYMNPQSDYAKNTTVVPKNEIDRAAIINQIMQGMARRPRPQGDVPQGQPVMVAGDVVPFRRQSIEPGMGLTEGARAYPGGANPIASMPESPQWEVYAKNAKADKVFGPFTKEEAGRVSQALKEKGFETHGYLGNGKPIDDAEKYQRALYLQRFLGK